MSENEESKTSPFTKTPHEVGQGHERRDINVLP